MNLIREKYNNIISKLDFKSLIFSFTIVILAFFFDRISKIKIIEHQLKNDPIYINDYINFELVWNTGVGFGFLSSSSPIFYHSISTVIGAILIFIIFLIVKSNLYEKITYSLVLGGAMGNLYDRITYNAVPDFIDIHYERFHWFTFNIADIFISIGILLLILKELLKNEKN